MPRFTFLVVRLPLLLATLLLVIGLGFGGWHFYHALFGVDQAAQIQKQMRGNIRNLESYYARFKTRLLNSDETAAYHVEVWKAAPDRYRVEMTRLDGEGKADLQVVIFDGRKSFFYDPARGDFVPVDELHQGETPHLVLESYWRSVAEAGSFRLLSEESGTRHRYYLVEVFPAEPHRLRVRELVWLEAKSLLPVRVEIYDAYDCLTQLTTFEVVQLNPVLDATLFLVEAAEQ
jgi:outer membrane lipoprotein-sorting protein